MSSVTPSPSATPSPATANRPSPPAAPETGDGFAALLDSASAPETAPQQARPPRGPTGGDGNNRTDAKNPETKPADRRKDGATESPVPAAAAPPAATIVVPVTAAATVAPAATAAVDTVEQAAATPAQLALAAIGGRTEPAPDGTADSPVAVPSEAGETATTTPAQTATGLAPGKTLGASLPAIHATHGPAGASTAAPGATPTLATKPGTVTPDAMATSASATPASAAANPASSDGADDTANSDGKTKGNSAAKPDTAGAGKPDAATALGDAAQRSPDAAHAKPDITGNLRAATDGAPPTVAPAPDAALAGSAASQSQPQPGAAPAPQVSMMMAPPAAVALSGLALHIASAAHAGRSRFDIQLDPAELGRIDVRLTIDRHGAVTSHVVVEKAETLDLLRRDASQLQRALDDAGLKTGSGGLQFSLRDQTPQSHDDGSTRPQRRIVIADDVIAAEAAGHNYGRARRAPGAIDIRV